MVAPPTVGDCYNHILRQMFLRKQRWHHDGATGRTVVVANHEEDETVITSCWSVSELGRACGHRVHFTRSGELVIIEMYACGHKEIERFMLDMDELVVLCAALIRMRAIVDLDEIVEARARIAGRFAHYLGRPPCEDMSRDDKIRILFMYRSRIFDSLATALWEALAALRPLDE